MAAGNSSRMGFPKGLLQINDIPLIKYHIDFFLKNTGEQIIIVLGKDIEKYKFVLKEYQKNKNISVIQNNNIALGPYYSLQLALNKLKTEFCFITPVDIFPPKARTWESLKENFTKKLKCVIPQFKNKRGHPVLISSRWKNELLKIDKKSIDFRLDYQIRLLNKAEKKIIDVADENVLFNLNSSLELEKFTKNDLG